MLTKWFGTSSSRPPKKDRSFRPQLESLEERNAPGGFGPGDDHGPPGPPHPPFSPVSTNVGTNVNAHGSFNGSTITDSFNTTVTNNITVNLLPTQSAAVQGLMGISNVLSATLKNPQLGALLNDEIVLAVDTYLTTPAISTALGLSPSVVNTLKADEATLSAAIAANPLENTPVGALVGTLAFDITMDALTSLQAKI
jgi:hypothetical protein